jgi:GR25 family glycosyltransferase involved in LPS biosynthesis
MIGCALSHLKVWKDIVSAENKHNNKRWHLVLEDDVVITKTTMNYLQEIENIVPMLENETIINLACPYIFCKHPTEGVGDSKLIKTQLMSVFTSAYLVTTDMAKALLRKYDRVIWHIDQMITFSGVGNIYVTSQSIVKHKGLLPEASLNVSHNSVMPILDWVFQKVGLNSYRHMLASTVFCLFLVYTISVYHLILVILLLGNVVWCKSFVLYMYIGLELLVYIIQLFI